MYIISSHHGCLLRTPVESWTPASQTTNGYLPRSWYNPESLSLLSDGAAIAQWDDTVGGHNLVQSNASYKPVYKTNIKFGNSVVRMPGGSTYLRGSANYGITGTTNRSIFMARKQRPQTDGSTTIFVMGLNSSTGGNMGITVGKAYLEMPQMNVWVHNRGAVLFPYYSNNWIVHKLSNNGTNVVESVNNIETTNQTINLSTIDAPLCLGRYWNGSVFQTGSNCFDGDVGEVLIYDGFITGEDEQQIIEYLMNKWVIDPVTQWEPKRSAHIWECWSSKRSGAVSTGGTMPAGCDVSNGLVLSGTAEVTSTGIYFPSDTALAVSTTSIESSTLRMTASAWIKPTSWVSGNNYIIDRWNGTNTNQWNLFVSESEGYKLSATFKTSSSTYTIVSSSAISLNTYTHVALSWTGSVLQLYINGSPDGASVNTVGIAVNTARISFIGCQKETTSPSSTNYNKWRGYIDNVYIWIGHTLTSQEISEMYNDDPNNP